jgi:hypothetical protein
MAQKTNEPIELSAWLALILVVLLLFLFHSLLGNLTSSHLANTLIVGVATLGSGAVLTFAYVTSIGLLRGYRVIREQFRYLLSPQMELLRPEDLPPELRSAVGETASALSALGFPLIGCVKTVPAPGKVFYMGILHNPRSGTIARNAQVDQDDQSDVILVFQTRFADARECTTGHVSPRYFGRVIQALPKGRTSVAFFEVKDPARLARLHAAAVERHHSAPVDTATLDPISIQMETFQREMAIQLDAGYLSEEGDEYRATQIGALKMALKLVWPVFVLRIKSARRRADRFLAETRL